MKKYIIFILFFNISSLMIYAQNTVIYDDEFDDNSSIWGKDILDKTHSSVNNGVLSIKSDRGDAIRWFGQQIFINYRKDFTIETKMKQTAGKPSEGYGLMWGSRGWEDSYFFIISSTGYFSVGKYSNSKFTELKKWTKSSQIKPIRNYNVLRIEKVDRNIVFYINGEAVYTTFFMAFNGQMHGFLIQSGLACQVDYLKVTNDVPSLDIADVSFEGEKKNIGPKVNSSATDIAPIISADGQILYFARGYYKDNFGGRSDEADIWYSIKQSDGSWGHAKNIGYPLNNSGVNVVVNATPDGNTLFLEGLYNSDGSFRSDQGISVTHKTSKGWSVPKKVKVEKFYNTNIYETYFFTTDQQILILSVERDDTFGDLDLYVSFRRDDGTYSEPKNMGAVLNTYADEGTPFMAPDGKTLYFSTSGFSGIGSNDIYMSKRLDDTWLHWSKPKNLGTSINTDDWDTYLSLSAKGDVAFLVSTAQSYGAEDIFIIEMDKQNQPEPVVLIKGKVLDEKTKRPVSAKITYEDISTGEEVGIANSNPSTGEYQIVLPYGKQYAFRAEANKYIAQNENIDLRNSANYQEITRNLYLMKIAVGEVIVLNNVFFAQGSAELQNTSFAELDRIVKIMKDNPKMKVELRGHTDNRGDATKLMNLSKERVNVVKDYIVEKGISTTRIEAKAFGGSLPINKNDTELEHSKNRRVEFKILEL